MIGPVGPAMILVDAVGTSLSSELELLLMPAIKQGDGAQDDLINTIPDQVKFFASAQGPLTSPPSNALLLDWAVTYQGLTPANFNKGLLVSVPVTPLRSFAIEFTPKTALLSGFLVLMRQGLVCDALDYENALCFRDVDVDTTNITMNLRSGALTFAWKFSVPKAVKNDFLITTNVVGDAGGLVTFTSSDYDVTSSTILK